ncbi:hypothetical protein QVD17_31144 [Tagetes erecta]|uniref:Uncharacterized protein n=1 Tax=Tagetes erecta TaxID=13708 RepID=A0AAD8K3T3_TARER|nr:hypothetical protein QVD17_31144 [Tagetes erecta]
MIERLPDCGGCCPKDSEYELWQKRCIDNEKKLTPYLMEVAFHLILWIMDAKLTLCLFIVINTLSGLYELNQRVV